MLDWKRPKFRDLPGLRMAYWEAGNKKADRPTIVLCHGFPEIAYSWRHLMPALAEAGFHVIAPDQRGYGFTGPALDDNGTPDDVPLYDMEHLCGDLAHLLDALEIEKAVFCGHDWGGLVVWQMPYLQPARVAGIIGVNTPLMPRFPADPIELMRTALGDDMYIVAFQNFGPPEAALEVDIGRSFRLFYRRGDGQPASGPWSNFALFKILEMPETDWPGTPILKPEEQSIYEDAFRRSGFRGPINWYRNFTRNWEMSADQDPKISQPCLMICADRDPFFPVESSLPMQAHIADLETQTIQNCGHWTQTEQPEALARLTVDWLTRRFV